MKRYASIRTMDVSNGEGIGISLFVQGCHLHCKNCFNPGTWDFDGGKEWTRELRNEFIKLASKMYVKRISFLGGEPLCEENVNEVYHLISEIKNIYQEKKIWVYTGYLYGNLLLNPVIPQDIWGKIDVLVDGPYIDEKKDYSLLFRGSSNQRLIDIPKSIERGEVICYQPSAT